MKNSIIEKFCGAIASIFYMLFQSRWFVGNAHLLQIDYWGALIKTIFELGKVGIAGVIGAAGGAAGKKYFFPFIERLYKKFITKKNKS